MRSRLRARSVLLCVGPGGVGKTTCAAAVALAAARQGRTVVVVTIDPSRRLASALGLEHHRAGDIVRVVQHERGSLDALVLETRSVFDEIVRAYARDQASCDAILQNPIYQATVQRLGGALEYAAMARLQLLHASRSYDLIVLDTPPTANAIDFLEAPDRVREVVENPAARLLTKTGKLGMKILNLGGGIVLKAFQALGGGPFLADLGAFLSEFASVLEEFHKRAGDFSTLLRSPETGVLLVSSATAFSIREAAQFLDVLEERGLAVDAAVLNRFDPPLPPAPPPELMRPALLAELDAGQAEITLARVTAAYARARAQAQRSALARQQLEHACPSVPVHTLVRTEPPPATQDELTTMGETLV